MWDDNRTKGSYKKSPAAMPRGLSVWNLNYSSLAKCLMVRTIWLV